MARIGQFLLLLLMVMTPMRCESSRGSTTPKRPPVKRSANHPHTTLTTPDMIVARGYPAEVHHVITDDGYILALHRIPHGRNAIYGTHAHSTLPSTAQAYPTVYGTARGHARPYLQPTGDNESRWTDQLVANRSLITVGQRSRSERRVVFLQHGLLASSAVYVMNDPDQALAFVLADEGYDVWLGNVRGNFYTRRHVYLSPEQPEFWDFSWNEMARYDLPAMLGYVRRRTGAEKVSYVGHSMGAGLVFAMLNYHPSLNSWIRVMAALAPAAYAHNGDNPLGILMALPNEIIKKLLRTGKSEVFRLTPGQAALRSSLCGPAAITSPVCNFIIFISHGPNSNYVDRQYLPALLAHWPAGTSLHTFIHLLQLYASRRFQAFDYGETRNLVEYGSTSPPDFSLSHTKLPVGIFWTQNDWVTGPLGVQQTAMELPWLVLNHQVQPSDFNHIDFIWAENAYEVVYRPLIDLFNGFY